MTLCGLIVKENNNTKKKKKTVFKRSFVFTSIISAVYRLSFSQFQP